MDRFSRKPIIFRGPLAKKIQPSSASLPRCASWTPTQKLMLSPQFLLHLNKAHLHWIKLVFDVILDPFINPKSESVLVILMEEFKQNPLHQSFKLPEILLFSFEIPKADPKAHGIDPVTLSLALQLKEPWVEM